MVVRRTHTSENVAPALVVLLAQVNGAYPNRLRTTEGHDSDGIWPSAAHSKANPNSDHEAGNALDIDDDLSGVDGKGPSVDSVVAAIAASLDPRVAYIIHHGRIWRPASGWTHYDGSNPHETHAHISVRESMRRDARRWVIVLNTPVSQPKEDQVSDRIVTVCVTPEKYPALEKFLREQGIYATGTKYEGGQPIAFPINPAPFRTVPGK